MKNKGKLKIEIKKHNGFKDFERANKKLRKKIDKQFGRFQFIYRRFDIIVSLIEVKTYSDKWVWEAWCISGDLFEDTRRFNSRQEAEDYIIELMHPEDKL